MSLLFQEWEENQEGPKYFPPGMNEHNGPHELKNKSLWKIRTFFYHESLQEQHDRDDLPDQIEILSSREEIPADVPPEPPLAQPEAISPCPVAGNPWLQSRRAEEKFPKLWVNYGCWEDLVIFPFSLDILLSLCVCCKYIRYVLYQLCTHMYT